MSSCLCSFGIETFHVTVEKGQNFKCCTRNINVLFLCREDSGFMMVVDVLEVQQQRVG